MQGVRFGFGEYLSDGELVEQAGVSLPRISGPEGDRFQLLDLQTRRVDGDGNWTVDAPSAGDGDAVTMGLIGGGERAHYISFVDGAPGVQSTSGGWTVTRPLLGAGDHSFVVRARDLTRPATVFVAIYRSLD